MSRLEELHKQNDDLTHSDDHTYAMQRLCY